MDVAELEAEQEKLQRKIKHAKRLGDDDWPEGTMIVAVVKHHKIAGDGPDAVQRTHAFTKSADGYWARPGTGPTLKWSQVVQTLFDVEIVRLDVATGWESFDQIRKDQRRDAYREEQLGAKA